MASQRKSGWVEARALLQQAGREFLIIRTPGGESGWLFPGGRLERAESPEAALRRHVREQLGIELEIQIGQPPIAYDFGTHAITYRYYICAVRSGQIDAADANVRWVLPAQLREYEFDPPTQRVVDWLLAEP